MKTLWISTSLCVFALLGCKSSSQSAGSSVPKPLTQPPVVARSITPQPVLVPSYGWKEFHSETFEIHTLEGKAFPLPGDTRKLRVSIKAESAVFGGAVREAVRVAYGLDRKTLRKRDFQVMPCSLLMVDRAETECPVEPHEAMEYVVRDVRAEGTTAGAFFGFARNSHKMMERATLPNKVEISLSTWRCLENCRAKNPENE